MDGGSTLAFAKQVHTGLGKELHVLNYRLQESESELATLKKEEADRTRYLANLEIANKWLQQLVEQINTENINKIHLLVNQALTYIFFDQKLEFRIVSEVKRNQTVYRCEVKEGEVVGNLQSFGGGVWCVISVILKILFNRLTKRFPLIVLDESLSFLADKYVPYASAFLKEFSQKFDMPIILVTHNRLFCDYADREYEAVQGAEGSYFQEIEK